MARAAVRLTSAVVVLALGVGGPLIAAADAPFGDRNHPVTADAAQRPPSRPAAQAAGLFRVPWLGYRALAGFQGARCPHRPSCSTYALRAFDRNGSLLGAWLTANRLIRGGRGPGGRPLPRDADGHLLDPLESADFWLHEPGP